MLQNVAKHLQHFANVFACYVRRMLKLCGIVTCKQESHAVAREPREAAAVVFGLKFADNIHSL